MVNAILYIKYKASGTSIDVKKFSVYKSILSGQQQSI
jgi:hypothetical protein